MHCTAHATAVQYSNTYIHTVATAPAGEVECVGGCQRRRSVISPAAQSKQTLVHSWRNHTEGQRQVFHRHSHPTKRAGSGAKASTWAGVGDRRAVSLALAASSILQHTTVGCGNLRRPAGCQGWCLHSHSGHVCCRSPTWRARVLMRPPSLARRFGQRQQVTGRPRDNRLRQAQTLRHITHSPRG